MSLFSTQGKNIKGDEFQAIGNQLSSLKWELPDVCEFKDDLPMPVFKNVQPELSTTSSMAAIANGPPPADGPVSETQWAKVKQMAAWPYLFLFYLCFC